MASPLDLIEKGIKTADWNKVVLGFLNLSGKKLKAPAGKGTTLKVRSVDDVPEEIQTEIAEKYVTSIKNAIAELSLVVDMDSDELDDDDDDPEPDLNDEDDHDHRDESQVLEEEEPDDDEIPIIDPTVSNEEVGEEPNPFEQSDDGKAPPPVAGTVEAAASEARAIARGEKTVPDFTHVHTGVASQDEHPELGRRCRVEPFKPGSFKNRFKDDKRLFREQIPSDKKLNKGRRPPPRRPPAKKVKVKCFKCEKIVLEDPSFIPKYIKTKDGTVNEATSYVCDRCMKRSV